MSLPNPPSTIIISTSSNRLLVFTRKLGKSKKLVVVAQNEGDSRLFGNGIIIFGELRISERGAACDLRLLWRCRISANDFSAA